MSPCKGKVHHRTGHEGPEGDWSYTSTLSLTSALDGGWVLNAPPRPLYPHEKPGTHFIGGSVDTRAVWTGAENLATTGIRSPNRTARSQVLYRNSL